ncbi:MAG: 4'-phosphopantetheinyl transferase superfamily protein [Prochloraceae cyanobacterium]|nr:4'-phosphopantetheinyl transferase superfamily protein [Prochloraceae cyanobacterium]
MCNKIDRDVESLVLIKFEARASKNSQRQDPIWRFPPEQLNLAKNEVHIWRAELDLPAERVEELAKTLCLQETQRADRFHFDIHRQRFIVGRGILRNILGLYLPIEPEQIKFEYTPRGKPSVAGGGVEFNLSHSQDLAVYAFTRDRRVGIDLEYLRPMPDAENIARRFFSTSEYEAIAQAEEPRKQIAFFQIWTAKEAYLKATGEGLGGSLDGVEVSFTPGEPVRIVSIKGDCKAISDWCLYNFSPGTDFLASIAVESLRGR